MAKGPAVVVVARHGARLDAADKTWHLSSPTPYDPPLTYGGWTQGKALGLRIAALLHQRDNEQHEPEEDAALDPSQLDLNKLDISRSDSLKGRSARRPKKKKRKIIIHTSPFLRCVQTSTAVAAGITQFNPPGTPHVRIPTPGRERHSLLGGSTTAKSSRARSPMVEPLLDPRIHSHPKPRKDKILLRVDAFLGEWLSPDYFEDITPPPDSTLMVAAAKAGLLRRGDQIQEQNAKSSKGHFPGGWMRKTTSTAGQQSTPDASSASGGSLAQASPFNRERSSSQGSELSLQRTRSKESLASLPPSPGPSVGRKYEPPVPSYSISPSDSIPRGYVAHAQDACLQIDYQWDSMRPPQDWGDGGLYGDEWSTMHKRFRRGLAGMMDWYREHGTEPPPEKTPGFMFKVLSNKPSPPVSTRRAADPFSGYGNGIDADDDEELVLILITHGAGCNALLGAISNQPVLMDIGLASLSMAVRRTVPRKASVPTIHERRLSVADAGMSETYEMKMLASVDHLRPGTDPTKLTASQSQVGSPLIQASPSLDSRRRLTGSSATGSPIDSPFSIGEPHRTWSSSLGNVRRTNSSGSTARYRPINRSGSATPSSIGGGLWSGTRTPAAEASASPSIVAALKSTQSEEKAATTEKDPSVTATPDIPPINGTESVSEDLTRLDSKEERETGDKVPPLVSTQGRQGSASSITGLWGAKPQPRPTHGLWGPPKLDDVYEHGRGPKRRWTVTEHEAAM